MIRVEPPKYAWGTIWSFYCEECNQRYFSMDAAKRCRAQHKEQRRKTKIEVQIERNLAILEQLIPPSMRLRDTKRHTRTRIHSAIYRLYRECNLGPKDIHKLLYNQKIDISVHVLQQVIGDVFAKLCLSRESCVFKPFLLSAREIR